MGPGVLSRGDLERDCPDPFPGSFRRGRTLSAAELQVEFHRLHRVEPPPLIEGAHAALLSARKSGRTAICTSSQRQSLESLLHRLKMLDLLPASVSAEDCTRSKFDPQGTGSLPTAWRCRPPGAWCLRTASPEFRRPGPRECPWWRL